MNKHDFYKELMSEYTFDAEKIKANAKRGRFARQKIAPLTIGITAAVAACTVAVGTLAMTTLDNNNGVSLVDDSSALSAKSDTQRLKDAMARLEAEKESSELKDVLVTFTRSLKPSEVQAVLTAYTDGSVPVKALFFADGTRTVNESDIAAIFSNNSADVTAAAINCSGIIAAELAEDSSIYLVENMTEADFENSQPVDVESLINNSENVIVDIPDNTDAPDEPVAPVVPDNTTTPEESESEDEPDVQPEPSDDPESLEVSDENDDPVLDPEESSTPSSDTTTPPEETTSPSTEDTTQPEVPDEPVELGAAVLPESVKLPASFEATEYKTAIKNAESAFFVDEYVMYVKKSDGFGIYGASAGYVDELSSVDCADAMIHWISADGNGMIVSGKPDKDSYRNKLWYISTENHTITDLSAEDSVMDGTLTDVGYNEDEQLLVMCIKEDGMYYLSVHSLNNSGAISYISDPFNSAAKLNLLCIKDKTVYVAATDGTLTQMIACNINTGSTRIIDAYDNNPSIYHNLAFTHAVVSPSDNALTGVIEVFDPTTETFVRTDYFGDTLYFGVSRHSFEVADRFYTVSNGIIVPTDSIKAIADIEYKKSLSTVYAVTNVKNENVTIRDSVYSRNNLAADLTFSSVSESCTDAQKQAFIGALGVNNALALGKCREAGLTKPDELIAAIEAYYSVDAAEAIIDKCKVSRYGAIDYASGKLNPINADDCILFIDEQGTTTANGTVYIKAGTIGGKTAYTSIDISFVAENGLWKLAKPLA